MIVYSPVTNMVHVFPQIVYSQVNHNLVLSISQKSLNRIVPLAFSITISTVYRPIGLSLDNIVAIETY